MRLSDYEDLVLALEEADQALAMLAKWNISRGLLNTEWETAKQ